MLKLKVGLLSDVHAHRPDQAEVVAELVRLINDAPAPDLLILAGDISHRTAEAADFLGAVRPRCARCWVPGNHDIWVIEAEEAADSAERRYTARLPAISAEAGWHYLPGGPLVLDLDGAGVGVVGTLGWFTGEGFSEWFDAGATAADRELARRLAAELEGAVAGVPRGLPLIVVTHHLGHDGSPAFDAAQGNLWSRPLQQVLERHRERIALVVHGHRHLRYGPVEVDGLRLVAHPLGYPHQHRGAGDGYRLLEIDV